MLRLGQKGSPLATRTVSCIAVGRGPVRVECTSHYERYCYFRPTANMIVTSEPLEQVRALRHTDENPPTSTDEGMDFERCSALHNAIVKHAWVSSGFDLASMPEETIWSLESTQNNLAEMQQRLHPSVQEFLKRSLLSAKFPPPATSGNDHFFLFLGGLAGHTTLWEFTEDTDEDWLGLYVTGSDFSSTLTGIT